MGYTPNITSIDQQKIITLPSPMFTEDSLLGYNYLPGKKSVTLNHSLEYKINIDEDRKRNNPFYVKSRNPIAIFGCSFFGGMGIDDNYVLSSQLQKMTNNFSISNYSIPGHGMTSQYLILKEKIKEKDISYGIFEIASFHLHRNVGAYLFVKNFNKFNDVPLKYVISEKIENNLKFKILNIKNKLCFLEKQSALFYAVKKTLKTFEYSEKYLLDVQTALMDSTYNLSIENNVKPLFVVITKDKITNKIVQHLKENNYPYIISNVDYNDDDYNLNPHDQHPNEKAHKKYAEEIYEYICKYESCH